MLGAKALRLSKGNEGPRPATPGPEGWDGARPGGVPNAPHPGFRTHY
jgi:hypothetical protein